MKKTEKQLEEMFKDGRTLDQVVTEFKKNKALTALMQTGFNRNRAARILGASPRQLRYFTMKKAPIRNEKPVRTIEPIPLKAILQELEKELVIEALCRAQFNITHMASCLGISNNTARYLIKKCGLQRSDFVLPNEKLIKGIDWEAEARNFEKDIIELVLEKFKGQFYGSHTGAAKFMNTAKRSLRYRIKKLGIGGRDEIY